MYVYQYTYVQIYICIYSFLSICETLRYTVCMYVNTSMSHKNEIRILILQNQDSVKEITVVVSPTKMHTAIMK